MHLDPQWSRMGSEGPAYLKAMMDFFELTERPTINLNLTHIVSLAEKCTEVYERCNPIWDPVANPVTASQTKIAEARQWHLNRISEIKIRVRNAMDLKRRYYYEGWLGKITRIFLQYLGRWNNTYTTSILTAEDFLLFWDSRRPVYKCGEVYYERDFFRGVPALWVTQHLNLNDFFNYSPLRNIPVVTPFNYER